MKCSTCSRLININSHTEKSKETNYIQTAKYTFYNFLPLALLNQFRSYFNIFMVCSIIFYCIPIISPVDPTTEAIPFLIVLIIAIFREGYQDFKKLQYDREYNNSLSQEYNYEQKTFLPIKWRSIKMGQVIKVMKDEIIPVDLLILKSSNDNGFSYIQTSNLDGETNLKPREALDYCQKNITTDESIAQMINGSFEEDLPNKNIYVINGCIMLDEHEKIFFNSSHCLLRNGVLRNVNYIIGLVIYTGKETKIMQNIKKEPQKLSTLDIMLNHTVAFLIGLDLIMSGTLTAIGVNYSRNNEPINDDLKMDYVFFQRQGGEKTSLVIEVIRTFASYISIFSLLIPVSILVTLEVCKALQTIVLSRDDSYCTEPDEQTKYLSLKLHENLGSIKYIFSDKTGTLTRNEMEFKGCSIFSKLFYQYESNNTLSDRETLCTSKQRTIFSRGFNYFELCDSLKAANIFFEDIAENSPISLQEITIEFFTNIAINHNVLVASEKSEGKYSYTGSNPDEIVLVQAAKEIGVEFLEREGNICRLKILNQIVEYEILNRFEFSSERKRSSIIIKDKSGDIRLYMKGADNVIMKKINEFSKQHLEAITKHHLDKFSKEGLRTLCFSMKSLNEQDYKQWLEEYKVVQDLVLKNSQFAQELDRKIEELETNMLLLGSSALEDLLQDDVKNSIKDFLDAEINVWMLTGDKLDTAQSIGYSCKLLNDDTEVFKLYERNALQIGDVIKSIKKEITNTSDLNKKDCKEAKMIKDIKHRRQSENIPASLFQQHVQPIPIKRVNSKNTESKKILVELDKESNQPQEQLPNDNSIVSYIVKNNIINHDNLDASLTFVKKIKNEDLNSHLIAKTKTMNHKRTPFDFMKIQEQIKRKIDNLDNTNTIKKDEQEEKIISQLSNREESQAKGLIESPRPSKIDENDITLRNFSMIIEGESISQCLKEENRKIFFECVSQCRSVICSRCSPCQKAEVVKFIKSQCSQLTLAIGDGGNDINMIQSADIGIGIFGKEGYQAAYSSDFAFSQFRYLKPLLFTHGRFSLQRNTYFIHYSFFKNIVFAFVQFWFTFFSGFSGTIFYDNWYSLGFNSFMSVILPCVYSIFNEDIDVTFDKHPNKEMAKMLLPDLYKEMRDAKPCSVLNFIYIILLSIFFSLPFYFIPMIAFSSNIIDSYGKISSFADQSLSTYYSLVLFIYTLIFIDSYYFNKWVFGFVIGQYALSISFIFVQNTFDSLLVSGMLYDLSNTKFWAITFLTFMFNIMIVFIHRSYQRMFSKNLVSKIKNNDIMTNIKKTILKKKIREVNKYSRCLVKFKNIYAQPKGYVPENYLEKRLKDGVDEFKSMRNQTNLLFLRHNININ